MRRNLTPPLPSRRAELVAQPFGDHGDYLVRDRRAGESFTLGPAEYFLLAQLDGSRSAQDLRLAFTEQFGERLSQEELEDFLRLARERGLLQPDGSSTSLVANGWVAGAESSKPRLAPSRGFEDSAPATPAMLKRAITRLLSIAAAGLQWLGNLLSGAARKIQLFKLTHLDYVPRPDDIFIVTYPRSGTTWMQMILYQLTTDGDMDFPHIYEYCPWFESSSRSANGFAGRPSPRLFKSHLSYRHIPKGPCRYIYVARNGKDAAVSYYHLYRSHNGYQGTFDEFFELFMRGKVNFGSWFDHVKGWWRHRHAPNVLFLRYEDLLADLPGTLHKIIAFCGLNIPPERFPAILERCSFGFMKQHESQFDHLTGNLWEQGMQLNAFLRKGRSGEGKERLTPQQAARFDRIFSRKLAPMGIDFGSNGRKTL